MDDHLDQVIKSIKASQYATLVLSENVKGTKVAYSLNKWLFNGNITSLNLDVHYAEGNLVKKYISLKSLTDIKAIRVTLHTYNLGYKCGKFLNITFKDIDIYELILNGPFIGLSFNRYLAKAFKDTTICQLYISYSNEMLLEGFPNLAASFKKSRIVKLTVLANNSGLCNIENLCKFLMNVQVLHLDLSRNHIGSKGVEYLVRSLKNSGIMYLDLPGNNITFEGAKYLSEFLRKSRLLSIDLGNNSIGPIGAKFLADGLRFSQVTEIHLNRNMIECSGYKYLVDVVEDTNLSWINLRGNNLGKKLEQELKLRPYSIPRNSIRVSSKICHAFKELVLQNPISKKFEFIVPTSNCIDEYAFLIGHLHCNRNSRAHIYDMMCRNKYDHHFFDFNLMNKINAFIIKMPKRFNAFINSKILYLVKSYGSYNYVNLVKQFEDYNMCYIVKNLLLHRVLYYVDEDQEILHPYIYRKLHKYSMPLCNKQLEPNKIEEIISYYQSHPEIDDGKKTIDWFRSIVLMD